MDETLTHWQACQKPAAKQLTGNYCLLQPLVIEQHAKSLYQAFLLDKNHEDWTYLPYGPFPNYTEFHKWLTSTCQQQDLIFYAIIDNSTQQPTGMASYLNIKPEHGVIEVGHVHYSPLLQRKTAATEAMYLLLRYVFDELGYRRCEWKCDNNNKRSKRAAKRLGFRFEGLFRQHWVCKNRNRDTTWFAMIDKEWPNIKTRFEHWLNPANFTAEDKQITALEIVK